MDRVLLALLSALVGLLIGLFAPGVFPAAQQVAETEQAWLNPTTLAQSPEPTMVVLTLPRAAVAQTAVPPTLQAPARPPGSNPPTRTTAPAPVLALNTPVARTFVIPLQGGGEMHVVANDEAAARNNVRSQGGTPAD